MEHGTHLPDEQEHVVYNLKEITQILNDLAKYKTTLKVSFNRGQDVYLTTVIAVDAKSHTVYLDIGRDDAFNGRLLASHDVVFLKDEGIRIKWTSTSVSEVVLKDGKAIKIALPNSLIRLQRREYFRLETPIVNPVTCRISVPDEANLEEDSVLELTMVDVSMGGIGLVAFEPLDPALVVGATFNGCKINFPDVGMTNLTLQVKNIIPSTMGDGKKKYRIGLQYIEPSRGNEGLIRRYTFILERLEMARIKGEL